MRTSTMRSVWLYFLLMVGYVGFAQTPTTPSSGISFSNTYCSETTISWVSGNGSARIVVCSKNAAISNLPSNNTYYLANDSMGRGHSLGPDVHVVYNGAGNSVRVLNLEADTRYYFSIFEVNGGGTTFSYLTSSYPEDTVRTEWLRADFSISDPFQCDNVDTSTFTSVVSQSGSEGISYLWNFGDGNTSTFANPTHSYVGHKIYNVSLRVQTTGCSFTKVRKDTVAPLPLVDFILHPDSMNNDRVQCFNYAVGGSNRFAFRNISQDVNLLGAAYNSSVISWDFGDGTTGYQNHARKEYSQPGSYRVVVTLASSKNNREYCVDSAEMIVVVMPEPIDTSAIYFSDTSMCLNGNSFDFAHNHSDPTLVNTWDFGDGTSATGRSVTHSYSNFGKYYVTLSVVDTAGCLGNHLDSVRVIEQPDNYFTGLNPTYCEGDPVVQLVPNLPGGQFEGDQVDPATGEFLPVVRGLNTIRYIVQEGDCIDTATETTVVLELPVFSLQNDTSICDGTSLRLECVKGNDAFTWSTGSTDSFVDISTAQLVWLQKSRLGCRYRDSVIVTVIDAPVFDLGNDSTLCGDGSRVVNVTADEATYTWNDGYVGPSRNITQTGYYEVTVSNKCGSLTDGVTS